MEELARRVVACKHWRWMPGMLAPWSAYIDYVDEYGRVPNGYKGMLPDLTDPATLGCLLALVRKVLGDERAHCEYYEEHDCWEVWKHKEDQAPLRISAGETEAEAIVAALEAAQ